jgi:hypothetical protein
MRKQVEAWQRGELTDVTAKVVIYEAFVEGRLKAPKYLGRSVPDLYFEPKYEEFRPRTIWSLSSTFTSASQGTESHPQFKATAKLGDSWSQVLTIVLAREAVSTGRPSPLAIPALNGLRGQIFPPSNSF